MGNGTHTCPNYILCAQSLTKVSTNYRARNALTISIMDDGLTIDEMLVEKRS